MTWFNTAKELRGPQAVEVLAGTLAAHTQGIQALHSITETQAEDSRDLRGQLENLNDRVVKMHREVYVQGREQEKSLERERSQESRLQRLSQLVTMNKQDIARLRSALPAMEARLEEKLSDRLLSASQNVRDNMIHVATGNELPQPASTSSSVTCYICIQDIETQGAPSLCDNAAHAVHPDCLVGIIAAAGSGTGDGSHVFSGVPKCGICRGTKSIPTLDAMQPPVVVPASPINHPSSNLVPVDTVTTTVAATVAATVAPTVAPTVEGVATDSDDSDDSDVPVSTNSVNILNAQLKAFERFAEMKRQTDRDATCAKLIDDPQLRSHGSTYEQRYPRRSQHQR